MAEKAAQKKKPKGKRAFNLLRALLAILAIAALWEAYVRIFKVPIYLIPAPSAILEEIVVNAGLLYRHSLVTLKEIVLGFIISALVAIPLAVFVVQSKLIEDIVQPVLVFFQTMPKIAIAPLFLIWFGFGFTPKLLVIILISFFPIVIDTITGLKSVEREMLLLMRALKASRYQTFVKVIFPNALPNIFSGFKVAITLAVVGAVVAEWIVSEAGLGYLLLFAASNIKPKMVFAALIILTAIGFALYSIICALEKKLITYEADLV